ncbi:uncharacterized protein (DUF983 family) [Methylopila capsulata]|uniref:Membrane protein n=1 Tax=Methylopila capsulata TaxID=61654 RepID=A0A9W6IUR3_9HYPH|nr:DUF983 domain-containing protein [Methylopila capsulata]MBM7852718.1 uncharacterized protein (DUF983 family) [Methylopila capsulata]GLK56927.1 membrane protein [Methylopila capsulata]
MTTPTVSQPSVNAAVAGLLGRCPACGKGKLFKGFIDLPPACEVCGLDYGFADAGDGPAVFVTLIAGFLVLGFVLWFEFTFEPPFWVHLLVSLPLTLFVCLGMLRLFKGLLIALQHRNAASEAKLDR